MKCDSVNNNNYAVHPEQLNNIFTQCIPYCCKKIEIHNYKIVYVQKYIYCKSAKFDRYKIWLIYHFLSDEVISYIILFIHVCPNPNSAKFNSTPNLVDLQ